jgi:hypothetical protein
LSKLILPQNLKTVNEIFQELMTDSYAEVYFGKGNKESGRTLAYPQQRNGGLAMPLLSCENEILWHTT